MSAMNASDSAGGEEANPGDGGNPHGGGHRRGADVAVRDGRTKVPRADLDRAGGHALQVPVAESYPELAVEHGDACRNGPFLSYGGLAFACRSQVVGRRQALPD